MADDNQPQAGLMLAISAACSLLPMVWLVLFMYQLIACRPDLCTHLHWFNTPLTRQLGTLSVFLGPLITLLCLLRVWGHDGIHSPHPHLVLLMPWLLIHGFLIMTFVL
ncbi:hypothetical protein [Halomonas cupida]|uniref:hypothetical protein n=1 Tax=Halomonas cupida TaxID=44933 RepID=UPI003A91328D